ncbi:MAG: Panacea domain-containing protein [Brevinemataceae bacterium]
MSNLEKIIRYILLNYPNPIELSKPRLVKLIYLIDWRYTIENGRQYTDIHWIYNHYGPYVNDVIELMKKKPDVFEVASYRNSFDGITDKFTLKNREPIILEESIQLVANRFINYTYNLNWSDFINLVYSSYPIKVNLKYSSLNLVQLAIEFNNNNSR